MSYILEALADSEQARQQITAAPKYSLLPAVGEESPQHRRWPYALAGALLINAAVLQVWLRPGPSSSVASIKEPTLPHLAEIPAAPEPRMAPSVRSEKPAVDAQRIALRETPPQIALRETPPQIALRETLPPQPQSERVNARHAARSVVPTAAVPEIAIANSANDSVPMRPLQNAAPKPMAKRVAESVVATQANPAPSQPPLSPTLSSPTPSSPTLTSPAPASPSLAGTAAMPPALQKEMPALSVAGFIRDEGSSSMVIVNDRLVREGDEVAPGVKLEKILNETLVFNYKGYRFTR